jgi:hypothetical protein
MESVYEFKDYLSESFLDYCSSVSSLSEVAIVSLGSYPLSVV